MSSKSYAVLAALIFTLVAAVQLARAAMLHFPVVIDGHEIPVAASWIGFAIAALLALLGFTARR